MKKLFSLITVLGFCGTLMAQPPDIKAEEGMTFGAVVTKDNAIEPKDLAKVAAMDGEATAPVKVKGKVIEVCQAEGCWLKMETPEGAMMIRMKDHAFFVPTSLNGEKIVVEGTVTMKETTVAMLRHYAEDAGKSKTEIAAIKEPKMEMVMQATGILVL